MDEGGVLTKGGMQPEQALILTKPIGTGIILAGWMRGRAIGRWVTGALESMAQSSGAHPAIRAAPPAPPCPLLTGSWQNCGVDAGPAAPILTQHGAQACTDVTGFGLLGHLAEMVAASPTVGLGDLRLTVSSMA